MTFPEIQKIFDEEREKTTHDQWLKAQHDNGRGHELMTRWGIAAVLMYRANRQGVPQAVANAQICAIDFLRYAQTL